MLTLGMNNVFNQPPAVIFNGLLGTSDFTTYDFMGRYLYLRVSHYSVSGGHADRFQLPARLIPRISVLLVIV